MQFKYNDAGLRTQKINGSTITKYYWAGSNITHMTKGSDELHFWYDAAGLPSMVTYNDEKFYYKHNLQGDVIGLVSVWGTEVVTYTYDAWGKLLTRTGIHAETLGKENPLLYRGYIYDGETGLYYLQSRYYNPSWGRFINGDEIFGKTGLLLTHNIFANPINCTDPDGHFFMLVTAAIGVVAGAVVGGVVAAAAGKSVLSRSCDWWSCWRTNRAIVWCGCRRCACWNCNRIYSSCYDWRRCTRYYYRRWWTCCRWQNGSR